MRGCGMLRPFDMVKFQEMCVYIFRKIRSLIVYVLCCDVCVCTIGGLKRVFLVFSLGILSTSDISDNIFLIL